MLLLLSHCRDIELN